MGENEKLLDWLKADIVEIKGSINDLNDKVDKLNHFKMKAIGSATMISLLLTAVFQIWMKYSTH